MGRCAWTSRTPAGRYYVLQFVDAWTNNFAYVGRRATGTAARSFLLVGPEWDDEQPDDTTLIRFPTTVASIVGRWAVDGEADLPAVRELQRGLRLTPSAEGAGLPVPDPAAAVEFFERLRVALQAFPPAHRDRGYQQRFAPLGLFASSSLYTDPASPLVAALKAGLAAGQERLEAALKAGDSPKQNGWDLTYHVFDYNLDFFEVGTLDEDRWKLPDDPERYVMRAVAARAGLWGNHGYEAAYAMVYVDAAGDPLEGSRRYELRFAVTPPVGAFWSVTMYDTPEFFLDREPDRALLDRRPHARRAHGRGRLGHDRDAARGAVRARPAGELAADARRDLPPDPAHVRPRGGRLRRELRAAADRPRGLSQARVRRSGRT